MNCRLSFQFNLLSPTWVAMYATGGVVVALVAGEMALTHLHGRSRVNPSCCGVCGGLHLLRPGVRVARLRLGPCQRRAGFAQTARANSRASLHLLYVQIAQDCRHLLPHLG
jgi:hypothetical protein